MHYINYLHLSIILIVCFGGVFLFHALDEVVCPFLVKYFDMPIWHLTDEKSLDLLMAAELDMYVLSVSMSVGLCLGRFC